MKKVQSIINDEYDELKKVMNLEQKKMINVIIFIDEV